MSECERWDWCDLLGGRTSAWISSLPRSSLRRILTRLRVRRRWVGRNSDCNGDCREDSRNGFLVTRAFTACWTHFNIGGTNMLDSPYVLL